MSVRAVTKVFASNLDGGRYLFAEELRAILTMHRNDIVAARDQLLRAPASSAAHRFLDAITRGITAITLFRAWNDENPRKGDIPDLRRLLMRPIPKSATDTAPVPRREAP